MEDFDLFWANYPRKQKKWDARKAWAQTANDRPDMKTLIEAILKQCQTQQWMKDNGQYIPLPATWLRAGQWEDEVEIRLPGVVDGKAWHETAQGIEAKGKELGISLADYPHFPAFKDAVVKAAMVA
jgi:hypothetical protein